MFREVYLAPSTTSTFRVGDTGSDGGCKKNEKVPKYFWFLSRFGDFCRTAKINRSQDRGGYKMPMESRLTFRMTAKQLDQLRRYAEEKRMTLSRAARRLVLETAAAR
jgi:hypothetical protein